MQLALFYGFSGPEIKGAEVTLMNKDLTMVFEGGTKKHPTIRLASCWDRSWFRERGRLGFLLLTSL